MLTAVILAWAALVGWLAFDQAASLGRVGSDLDLYVSATRDWLSGGSFYPAHQLAGPYVISPGDILYPPTTIPLFVPFLVVPYVVFVLIPFAMVGWVIVRMRPRPWAWPLMAACLAFTPSLVKIVHLNPVMWVSMAVGLAVVWAWPGVLVLIKPSLAPFALIGIHRRSWWISLAAAGVLALLFLPMWPDYFTVLLNSRNPQGLLYSLDDVPLVVIPLIAWVARRRPMPVPVEAPDPLVLAAAT
jgi:hypothetical protein